MVVMARHRVFTSVFVHSSSEIIALVVNVRVRLQHLLEVLELLRLTLHLLRDGHGLVDKVNHLDKVPLIKSSACQSVRP